MLVDVRDPKEVAAGMIKGSVNIPMNELEKKIGTLPTDKPVVFVCGTGARSGEAYDTVKLLGGKVQASFLDADVKFNADGSFSMVAEEVVTEFQRLYTGRLWSVLGWDQLTALLAAHRPGRRLVPAGGRRLTDADSGRLPADAAVATFIERIDTLLRAEHHESYCGIVYADDLEEPRLIKIYDPNNLGSSCGSSKNPPRARAGS
jgi:rhodanese-related sulfurtransferase